MILFWIAFLLLLLSSFPCLSVSLIFSSLSCPFVSCVYLSFAVLVFFLLICMSSWLNLRYSFNAKVLNFGGVMDLFKHLMDPYFKKINSKCCILGV